eukprot:COSAG01_NODE_54732_length_330_cov_0.662338_1_plen_28_part_01
MRWPSRWACLLAETSLGALPLLALPLLA